MKHSMKKTIISTLAAGIILTIPVVAQAQPLPEKEAEKTTCIYTKQAQENLFIGQILSYKDGKVTAKVLFDTENGLTDKDTVTIDVTCDKDDEKAYKKGDIISIDYGEVNKTDEGYTFVATKVNVEEDQEATICGVVNEGDEEANATQDKLYIGKIVSYKDGKVSTELLFDADSDLDKEATIIVDVTKIQGEYEYKVGDLINVNYETINDEGIIMAKEISVEEDKEATTQDDIEQTISIDPPIKCGTEDIAINTVNVGGGFWNSIVNFFRRLFGC